MDANQFLDIFLEETVEHLESLNNCLLQLEKLPEDKSVLDEIFRVSHTLKGMAGTMGFTGMAQLTHGMENLLDGIRKQRIKVNTVLVDLLFECLDGLQAYANNIAGEGVEGETDNHGLLERLGRLLGAEKSEDCQEDGGSQTDIEFNDHDTMVLGKARQQGFNCFIIKVRLDKNCMLKSARAFIVFNTLEKKGDIIKSVPSVEDIEDEKFDRTIRLVIITQSDLDEIEGSLASVSELEEVEIREAYIPDEIDNFHLEEDTNEDYTKDTGTKQRGRKSITGKTVRVDINRLDNLMNLVSELIIIKTRLEENRDGGEEADTEETLEYLERITTNLHDAVMKVRMVPIERVFNRFPRMVRDLSKNLGKDTRLLMYGEETEVDRTVIDEIGDPLIHLIRNSIDHGIEPVEERKKLGKPTEGKIMLKAFHDGNTVVIEVEDDGSGIDIKRIAQKSVQSGLYSQQQLDALNEEELVELIFSPGFSTAGKVSDLSGRGVGLDVVKTKIESLGGMVEVENKPALGSKFIIRLPLTLAIIQALLVNVGLESYAIPLNSIKEIVTMEYSRIKNVQNREVVLLRGEILPIIRLDRELGLEDHSVLKGEMTIVVVRKGEKLAGMVVDGLIGQQEIVIKPLGKFLSGIRYIAGATILGDGRVSLILDVNPFL
ncbi:MAG: chemotaxis protein CheA [Bacillota bacterium]|nr:chemotaxis protein CheA [Bacillota bacterium]MDD3297319.1 chemotaxis protein CheA [Bacillota bacterium]MDD3850112.1 chemotaxis protein CheA [Bacillota bacterium]MDD4706835.1 chemotaxis protein CheA [Bacillota bacterium]